MTTERQADTAGAVMRSWTWARRRLYARVAWRSHDLQLNFSRSYGASAALNLGATVHVEINLRLGRQLVSLVVGRRYG